MRRAILSALGALVLPGLVLAAPPHAPEGRPAGPGGSAALQRVVPAIVGIHVRVPADRPSAATLGSERQGSGVVFDRDGHILTVSYLLLDAEQVDVTLHDGRRVPARLVGLDLEVGLGVVKLAWPGPWPAAELGDSRRVTGGTLTATLGVDEDGALVTTRGHVEAVRPFAAAWEYMLDRAFVVSPGNPAFGGGALVDAAGAVIGITALRLGEGPAFTNLAIPVEAFLPGKDELIARGRVQSRPPRPWLGLYTQPVEGGGLAVVGVSAAGPAARAGFRHGDVIVRLEGETVRSQADFYTRLWARRVGEELTLVVRRDGRFEAISVLAADRYRVFRTSER